LKRDKAFEAEEGLEELRRKTSWRHTLNSPMKIFRRYGCMGRYDLTDASGAWQTEVKERHVANELTRKQGQGEEERRHLEVGLTGQPMEDRLLASAQRMLYEQPSQRVQNGCLRTHQIPAFSGFADYLLDLATSPDPAATSPYCRIILPPRTGKTVVASRIIDLTGLCSTFVVPTKALVRQTAEELHRQIPGTPIGVYYGEIKEPERHGVNITTYATLQRHFSSGELPESIRDSALVFLDEAHHCMTSLRMGTLRAAFQPKSVRIALTATPNYDHKRQLHQFFPQLIHETDLLSAFESGLLAPARMWVAEVDVDGSVVRLVAGDFEAQTLGRLMSSAPFFKAVEQFRYAEPNGNIPALISCASRQQAYDLWVYLQKHKPSTHPVPGLILGDTLANEREGLLARFENGDIDTLIQVGVLIEGWNAPRCKLLLDLAPSLSRVRATQKYFRVMTRYRDLEARIYVLLPNHLQRQPVLPTDLLLSPGEGYRCGDLLGPLGGRERDQDSIERPSYTPIKSVKLKTRILASASLERPALNPNDPEEILRVLGSCTEFNSAPGCRLTHFIKLFFRHPLFVGTGDALLRYLGVPRRRKDYEAFLERLSLFQPGNRFLADQRGIVWDIERLCRDDLEYLGKAALEPNENGGKPIEPYWSSLYALCGGVRALATPEEVLLIREQIAQIRTLMEALPDRERFTIAHHLGLFGASESSWNEIGLKLGVSRERARQIFAKAIRILAWGYRRRTGDRYPVVKSVFEYPSLLEILDRAV
jgi:hypothetical protein